MSSSETRKAPSVFVYALAATVLFVLPFSFALLLFASIKDPKSLQFAFVCATSLASLFGLANAISMWNRSRAMAFAGFLGAVSVAFITWGFYAPDQKLILSICSLVVGLLAAALSYRPVVSVLRRKKASA